MGSCPGPDHVREHCEYLLTDGYESLARQVHSQAEIEVTQATARVFLIQLRILEVEAARRENRDQIRELETELRRGN